MSRPQADVRHLTTKIGLTENEIVERLLEIGVKTSQPTINRLKRGKVKSTSFDLGMGLIRLRQRIAEQSAQG